VAPAERRGRYDLTRRLYLRGLGLVYAVAFASLAVQVAGLVGDDGILPAGRYLAAVEARYGAAGRWYLPTIAWIVGTHTATLECLAWGGAVAGIALLLGVAPRLAAATCWVLYLSLVGVGQVFLHFQWDSLLLEAGLLGMLLAPGGLHPGLGRTAAPRPLVWLCWLLVFKLNVMSGAAKLLSGDPTWRSLRALEYHYWTTCLPTWTGWWANLLPSPVQRATALGMFVVELGVPFAIVCGRRLRHVAAALLIALQVGIGATGNYGFFNLLTIVLSLTLYDDAALARLCPLLARRDPPPPSSPWARLLATGIASCVAVLSLVPMAMGLSRRDVVPRPLAAASEMLAPFESFNGYGLFATMTTTRPEIVVEGTLDGTTWTPYQFRWKPGDPQAAPRFVEPHMPRLDWQMWFAALQGPGRAYWFRPFLERLAEGSPDVLALLAGDPFGGRRPLAVRARLYSYEFTTLAERRATGAWWRRTLIGPYAGPVRSRP
jgi:uncharacterized membrane protein YphA (DoxX/SURF4 family)